MNETQRAKEYTGAYQKPTVTECDLLLVRAALLTLRKNGRYKGHMFKCEEQFELEETHIQSFAWVLKWPDTRPILQWWFEIVGTDRKRCIEVINCDVVSRSAKGSASIFELWYQKTEDTEEVRSWYVGPEYAKGLSKHEMGQLVELFERELKALRAKITETAQ